MIGNVPGLNRCRRDQQSHRRLEKRLSHRGAISQWIRAEYSCATHATLATFYYLSSAVGSQFRPDGMPYFLFLLIGTGFYTFLVSGTHSFLRTIQEAQQSGTLEVLMTTSTRPSELLVLSAISAFAGAFIQFFIYVSTGIFVFAPNVRPNLPGVAFVFVFSVLIASAIGIFAAGLQISMQKGSAVLWALGSTSGGAIP
jgi:ABC-type multidrug transport system permease subunit